MHLTRISKKILIFIAVFLYFSGAVYADTRNFSFMANKTEINVRTPDGFYESSNIYPNRLDFVRTYYPDFLEVHAYLAPKGIPDTDRLSRYMILVTNKKVDKHKISQNFFDETREQMREQQFTLMNEYRDKIDDILKGGTSRVLKEYDVDFITEIGETVPLGVFIDNKNVIGLKMISNTSISTNGVNHSFLQLGSFSMVFVKNKIVNVYIYSDFNSEKDIVWIEGKTKELVNLLLKNN
jgi:hypothetical protein